MRMMASRYAKPLPAKVKKQTANVRHISAPLKGLSLSSKLVVGDPLTATILDNWVIEESLIKTRPGIRELHRDVPGFPVEQLVPFYGEPPALLAATNGRLQIADTGVLVKAGFTSNDWSATAFANLSLADYTVMVNGKDGVWSWDGGNLPDPAPVVVTSLSNANPAVVTVAAGDIAKFTAGMAVVIAGADGTHAAANGAHYIGSVGAPVNTFTLLGVDLSTATGPQTAGVTAAPPGSLQKEVVTAPSTDPWVVPNDFNIVLAHMNRLWFADTVNLAVYYLPIQQKSGPVTVLPLNAIFKRGGSIRAMYTWTIEGSVGLDDQLVIFTTNGEAAIYNGIDPDAVSGDFQLRGVFRFDAPMSKHCIVNYGGELYVLISTGLVPMSTMMRAETDQLGQSDRNIYSLIYANALSYRDRPGWQAMLNPSSGRLICNMPLGAPNRYQQAVRFMPNPIWATWSSLPSRCWCWLGNRLFIGDDSGGVLEMHPLYLNDRGQPIVCDVQAAWGNFGTPAVKQFKMLLPYIQSDGIVRPYVDFRVDYNTSPPLNQPDISMGDLGSTWDVAEWNTATWAQGVKLYNNWQGVSAIGRVGAPRLSAAVLNCTFALTGWDVLFEGGSVFG